MLEMRWRVWLTRRYVQAWMDKQVYYRLELEHHGTDNPDQRIAEDLRLVTSNTLALSLGLLSSVVTLVSFVGILWTISGPLSFTLAGHDLTIPGYMVWAAIVYALFGSVLTHLIGRPLIALNFQEQRLEADFRYSLVRLRENSEGVALYRGEPHEQVGLLDRFERIRLNWWALMKYTKRLTGFTVGYGQLAVIFPIMVAAPRFFACAITLGSLFQIASACGGVRAPASGYGERTAHVPGGRAGGGRLPPFEQAPRGPAAERAPGGTPVVRAPGNPIGAGELTLARPNGRVLPPDTSLSIE